MAFSAFPNTFHNDKWSVSFSNVPTISDVRNMKYYDNYVKSLVLPDYNMEEITSEFRGFTIRHPVGPKANNNLSQIQLEFKVSEDLFNYLNLFQWMQSIKYGDIESSDFLRKYTVKSINLNIMDNQKRDIAVIRFTQAFLLNLSSISLNTGSSDEVVFTANFSYEEVIYETKSISVVS